jgi:hypothetical protein
MRKSDPTPHVITQFMSLSRMRNKKSNTSISKMMIFKQRILKRMKIKHRDDKGRTYEVMSLDWSYTMYDVHNKNGLIENVCLLFLMCVQIIFHHTTTIKPLI